MNRRGRYGRPSRWKRFWNWMTFGAFRCWAYGHTRSEESLDYTVEHNYYVYGICDVCRTMHIVGWSDAIDGWESAIGTDHDTWKHGTSFEDKPWRKSRMEKES